MFLVHYYTIILFVLLQHHAVLSDVKVWKYDTLTSSKENFNAAGESCSGIFFPEYLGAPAILDDNMTTSDLVLPRYGKIYLQNNIHIIFSGTPSKCMKMKQLEYRSWLNPRNWQHVQGLNRAVPHTNRVPCKDDEVVFRQYPAFAMRYPKMDVQIKKITIGNWTLDHHELQELLDSTEGHSLFQNNEQQPRRNVINVKEDMDCYQKYGCPCQMDYKTLNDIVCNELHNDVHYKPIKTCYAPIEVIGHCDPFCGASITIQITKLFNVNFYKNLLMTSLPNLDSHIDRVQGADGKQYFQIVLTDSGEYSGDCTDAAEAFYKKFIDGKLEHGIKKSTFLKSEGPYHPDSQLNTITWIVVGTLMGCLFLFSTIFVLGADKTREYKPLLRNLKKRCSKVSVKSMREQMPFRFARFENREDGGLSLAGSIVSLDKNFESHMYGATIATTSGNKTNDLEFVQEMDVAEELSGMSEENNDDGRDNLISTAMESLSENIEKIEKIIEKK